MSTDSITETNTKSSAENDVEDTSTTSDSVEEIYEVGFHLLPTIQEEKIKEEADSIQEIIKKNNGVVISKGEPLLIDLAYTISRSTEGKRTRFKQAYFGWIKFEAKPADLPNLKEALRHNDVIVRSLVIKTLKDDTVTSSQAGKSVLSVEESVDQLAKEAGPAESESDSLTSSVEKVSEKDLEKSLDSISGEDKAK